MVIPTSSKEALLAWNHFTKPEVIKNAPVAEISGHGDSSTI